MKIVKYVDKRVKLKHVVEWIATTLVVGITFVGCSSSENKSNVEDREAMPVVQLQGYHYDEIAELPDSLAVDVEGGAYARVTGDGMLPVSVGTADISVLRDSLERLGKVMVINDAESEPRLTYGMKRTDIVPNDSVACTAVSNRLSVALMTPQVIVWRNYRYSYPCRAAHGSYKTSFVNYCISSNRILGLSDLFKPGYEKELTDMLREKLKEDCDDLIAPLEEIGIPTDFEVTERGINFVYGLYEVAPYSSGEVTVAFCTYEIEDMLQPDVLSRLWGFQ